MTSAPGRVVARRSGHHRPDIEGMRGIAVLLVVLFHAGPFLFTGGFVGVDVFFVISGFLITGLLLRERETAGRIGLTGFYARRMRRLLPAGAIVIVVTLLWSVYAVPPLDLPRVALDGASAALSVSNLRFATQGGYFDAGQDPSPFLHFWSLSVEEQFYLFWPVLLLVVTRVGRPRLLAGVTLALIAAGSFALCVSQTQSDPQVAFYLLHTRAWELALGGLLAVAWPLLERGGRVLGVLGWAGLVAVLASSLVFDEGTAWPGTAALVPVLGTVALLAGGTRQWGPGPVLCVAPLRFVGRVSYAFYLWHWPVLVLPAIAAGEALPVEVRLGLVGVAFLLAVASTLIVEEPIREGRVLPTVRPRRVVGIGLASMGLLAVLGVGVMATSPDGGWFSSGPVTALGPEPTDPPLDLSTDDPGASDDPFLVLSTDDPGASDDPFLVLPSDDPGASDDPFLVLPSDDPLLVLPSPSTQPSPALRPTPAPTPAPTAASTIEPTQPPADVATPRPTLPPAPTEPPAITPPPTPIAQRIPPPGVPVIPREALASPSPSPSPSPAPSLVPSAVPGPTPVPSPTAVPTQSAVPSPAPTRRPRPRPTPKPTPVSWALPADVRPALARAKDDEERLRADGCLAFEPDRTPADCVYGDPKGKLTVALVGDSHAAHWFPAVERIAKARGWRLVVMTKVSCPFTEMPLENTIKKRDYPECADFVGHTIDRLRKIKPDLVITTALRWFHPLKAADDSPAAQGRAIGDALNQVPGRKVVIVDTPWNDVDAPPCLSKHKDDVRACAVSRSLLGYGGVPEREKAAARTAGAALLDFTRVLCDRTGCPVVADGIIRYRDDHHLTETFARSLAPVLDKALQKVLAAD